MLKDGELNIAYYILGPRKLRWELGWIMGWKGTMNNYGMVIVLNEQIEQSVKTIWRIPVTV